MVITQTGLAFSVTHTPTSTDIATPTATPTANPNPTATSNPTATPTANPTATPDSEIKAAFDAEPTLGILDSTGKFTVKFTDKSTGDINSWLWEFGDGSNDTKQNPEHEYREIGLFTVTLTVSGFTGQDTLAERNLIDVRPPEDVVANFDADPTVGIVPLEVTFTDKSLNNPTSWLWDFGDGGNSEEQNPTHTYNTAGIFTVLLTVTNSDGTDTIEKQNLINVSPEEVVAQFRAEPTVGFAPLTVKFTDISEPVDSITSWLWDFGDGGNDTKQNPEHVYSLEGFYTVKLTVGNASGENDVKVDTNLIIVKSQGVPIAEFKASPTAGLVNFDVKFTDLSQPEGNIASWIWDFGDGGISTEQSPTHTYKTEGIRTVKLTVSNSNGANTETRINLIGARDSSAPIAEFSATPTAGQAPVLVTFADNTASDGIASWLWDFGDGATSTDQNPTHTYTTSGTFSVKLTASSPSGIGEENKTNLIRVVGEGEALAEFGANPVFGNEVPFEVQFLDNSVGEITSWGWDFGDGNKSTEQNPVHSYANRGEYSVKLKVNAADSENSFEKNDFINVLEEATPTPTETPTPVLTVDPESLPRSSAPIAVTVTASDVNGNPLEGVTITTNAQGRKVSVAPQSTVTDSNGGIGTNDPGSANLAIVDSTKARFSIGQNVDGTGLNHLGVWYDSTTTNADIFTSNGNLRFGVNGASGSSFMSFGKGVGGATAEWMRLDSSGNVGIGTTAPQSPLQVSKGTPFTMLNQGGLGGISNTITNTGPEPGIHFSSDMVSTGNRTGTEVGLTGLRIYDTGAEMRNALFYGGFPLYVIQATPNSVTGGLTDRMVIDTTGNVGIGTTNPGCKLDVAGSVCSIGTSLTSDLRFKKQETKLAKVEVK